MITGLQPLNRFNVLFPGAVPQAGIVRTFGAGEGERVVRRWRRWPQMGEGVVGWALTDLRGGHFLVDGR